MHPAKISPCQPPATTADGAMAVNPSAGCVVDTLHAQLPARALRYSLIQQFTKPHGFWVRAHAACDADWILPLYTTRAERAAA